MKRQRRFSFLLSAALSWVAPLLARAQADEDVLIHGGVELRRQGRNAEALAEFRRAYDLSPSPRARAQIALAEQALGQWAEAEADLVHALANETDLWIRRNRQALALALQTIGDHVGSLEIESNVEGASISVNGNVVGRSPLASPMRVVAGATSIELQATGYDPVERRIEVPARGQVKAAIIMVPLPAQPGTTTAAPPAKTGSSVATRVFDSPRAPPAGAVGGPALSPSSEDATSPPSRTLAWVAFAASGALLATGVVAQVIRQHNADIYNDDSRCYYGLQSRDQRCGKYRHTADAAELVAIIGYAAGAAALIAGTALLLTAPEKAPAKPSLRLAAGVAPGTGYVACAGSF